MADFSLELLTFGGDKTKGLQQARVFELPLQDCLTFARLLQDCNVPFTARLMVDGEALFGFTRAGLHSGYADKTLFLPATKPNQFLTGTELATKQKEAK
jgi:hypothetical protein